MSLITTHVLDVALGRPASGVPVVLDRFESSRWTRLGGGATDPDGRLRTLLPSDAMLEKGRYRLVFETAAYFVATGRDGFFPEVSIVFEVREPAQHHHVPLLLSPYGYSTYRGS